MNIEELERYKDLSVAELIELLQNEALDKAKELGKLYEVRQIRIAEILAQQYYKCVDIELDRVDYYHIKSLCLENPKKNFLQNRIMVMQYDSICTNKTWTFNIDSVIEYIDSKELLPITKEEFENAWIKISNLITELKQ